MVLFISLQFKNIICGHLKLLKYIITHEYDNMQIILIRATGYSCNINNNYIHIIYNILDQQTVFVLNRFSYTIIFYN